MYVGEDVEIFDIVLCLLFGFGDCYLVGVEVGYLVGFG